MNEERTIRISSKGVIVIAASLVGVAIGILVTWTVGLAGGAQIQVQEGYAWVNETGTAVGLSPDGEAPGSSYVVAGVLWREQSGPWHYTFPTCLARWTGSDGSNTRGQQTASLTRKASGRTVLRKTPSSIVNPVTGMK